jgi:hypothetical protein
VYRKQMGEARSESDALSAEVDETRRKVAELAAAGVSGQRKAEQLATDLAEIQEERTQLRCELATATFRIEEFEGISEALVALLEERQTASTVPIVLQSVRGYPNTGTEAFPFLVQYIVAGVEQGFCSAEDSDCQRANPTIGEALPVKCRSTSGR